MLNIFSLKGKASRFDWWVTTLVAGIIAQVAVVLAFIARIQESGTNWFAFVVALIVVLLAMWVLVAVTACRFRDRGDSAWMTLLLLIPIVGEIWILVVCGFLPNPHQAKRRVVVRQVTNGEGQE